MSAETWRCERAGSAHQAGLLALFEGAGSGCYCGYWHFEGDKNAWLERCFIEPERNRAALAAKLAGPELCGVVALAGSAVCGWLKVERASSLPRLYAQRVYRGLPCLGDDAFPRERVYAIGCLYVAEAERGRGVAQALVISALDAVKSAGGAAVEAFPRQAPEAERLRADQVFLGPETLYMKLGFERVTDARPYPVWRRAL